MVKIITSIISGIPDIGKKLFMLSLCLLVTVGAYAASDNYYFGTSTGVGFEDLSTDATEVFATPTGSNGSYLYNIGFNFSFGGVPYTTFSMSPDGMPALSGRDIEELSSSYTTGNITLPAVTALWNDRNAIDYGTVRYKVVGSAPNRKLVIEWSVRDWYGNPPYYDKTFQVWFNENNTIQFVYGDGILPDNPTIGLMASTKNFLSLAIDMPEPGSRSNNNFLLPQVGTAYTFSTRPVTDHLLSYTSR